MTELAAVRSVPCAVDPDTLAAARDEMLAVGAAHGHADAGWVLGVDLAGDVPLPAMRQVDRALRATPALVPENAIFSFAKTAAGPPADATGIHAETFHVDTHPAGEQGLELRRVLVNLAPTARRVRIGATTRPALEAAGQVDPDDWHVRALPTGTTVDDVALPAYDGRTVHALDFWPSLVPHVGVNDGAYLLVSYELALASPLTGANGKNRTNG